MLIMISAKHLLETFRDDELDNLDQLLFMEKRKRIEKKWEERNFDLPNAEEMNLMYGGKKIDAIKRYKERTGLTLSESKFFMEKCEEGGLDPMSEGMRKELQKDLPANISPYPTCWDKLPAQYMLLGFPMCEDIGGEHYRAIRILFHDRDKYGRFSPPRVANFRASDGAYSDDEII